MTGSDQTAQGLAAERPARRAGTFTFGIVLVLGDRKSVV